MDIVGLLITWLVIAVSFIIISYIPIGVEIDSFGKALTSAAVFGILNAVLKPVLTFLGFPLTLLTLGLFLIVINAAIFGLAAWLVSGFRLNWGIWSALLGSIALTFINSVLFHILDTVVGTV
ncbi:phage holin family protein [Oscillatoriales cyanobacterium LEGE 11467]|uniref:Phage holin family protein n=1 Tax=Zarconia navalis LEGE 11467 TaxID=1828826 RepID=A0A928VXC8_9CYAN|nr:phage holin family protein [Zarconia navalis]MBE9040006.1 phage holin family protein [Zarconia navalis LEGE 11467]